MAGDAVSDPWLDAASAAATEWDNGHGPRRPAVSATAIATREGGAMGERLTAAIRRWRERRRLRRVEALERENTARANLRDYKPFTGHEPGPPGGAF